MTAEELARKAVKETQKYEDYLSWYVVRRLRFAVVAEWLYIQDKAAHTKAAATAERAMAIILKLPVES